MANIVLHSSAPKKSELQQNEQQHSQTESSTAHKIKGNLMHYVSYISGDMAPLGKWMKGRLYLLMSAFTWSLKCTSLKTLILNNILVDR